MDPFQQIFDLNGKTVAVLCWSDASFTEVVQLKEQGVNVIIGLRDSELDLRDYWSGQGLKVFNIWEAVQHADIIQVW